MYDSYEDYFARSFDKFRDSDDFEAFMHGEDGPDGSTPMDHVPTQREVNLEILENDCYRLESNTDTGSDTSGDDVVE